MCVFLCLYVSVCVREREGERERLSLFQCSNRLFITMATHCLVLPPLLFFYLPCSLFLPRLRLGFQSYPSFSPKEIQGVSVQTKGKTRSWFHPSHQLRPGPETQTEHHELDLVQTGSHDLEIKFRPRGQRLTTAPPTDAVEYYSH